MTDLRKLLIEARAWIVANEKHESVCPTRVMGTWGRCRCGFVSIIGRIDGALAEKVEPVACDYGIPMLGGTYETQSGDRVKMVAINQIDELNNQLAKFKENADVYRTRIINAIHMLDAGHTKKQVRLHLSIIHDETMTEAK